MNARYSTGRNTRRGKRDTSAPYAGCSSTMQMKVPVNSACRVNSPKAMPRAWVQAMAACGNTAATSADAPIASRTGRST